MSKKILPISIVCATHKGKRRLPLLLNSILKNTALPKEIIICGTDQSDFNLINIQKFKKLKIKKIISRIKNQTIQRNLAIKNVNTNIIAQCDDDLELESNYILNAYNHFLGNKKKRKIVSAAILFKDFKHQAIRWNNAYYNFAIYRNILLFFNSYKKLKYMSVLKSGRIIPLLPKDFLTLNKSPKILDKLEWVCSTIIYEKSAIKDAYKYNPKIGEKAYYEDVFFSHSLYKKKYNLLIDRSVIAYHPKTEITDINIYFKTIKSQKKIIEVFKKSKIFFYLDVLLFTVLFLFLKTFNIKR